MSPSKLGSKPCGDDTADADHSVALRARLESLPQELYDLIYDFTLTPPTGTRHTRHITNTYRPPAILQVSRSTRAFCSKGYYGNGAVFRVPTDNVLKKWYRAFEAQIETVERIELPQHKRVLQRREESQIHKIFAYGIAVGAVSDVALEEDWQLRQRRIERLANKLLLVDADVGRFEVGRFYSFFDGK